MPSYAQPLDRGLYEPDVNDDAIFKMLYLAIRNASKKWAMPVKQWGMALNQFAILFGNELLPLL